MVSPSSRAANTRPLNLKCMNEVVNNLYVLIIKFCFKCQPLLLSNYKGFFLNPTFLSSNVFLNQQINNKKYQIANR